MSFKIIAIRPLKGCKENILKNLKIDQLYFFDNSYKADSNDFNNVIKRNDELLLAKSFFYYKSNKDTSLENVNIQAVAGRNGDGKSSLIELFIRVMNNFYKEYGISSVTKNLLFVEGLNADLFFEKDDKICRILIDSREIVKVKDNSYQIDVKFFQNNHLVFDSLEHYSEVNRLEEFINIAHLFFTLYINYSIYGLDENDFVDESYNDPLLKQRIIFNQSWISQIFHKNDGYQTPIVLHPFRKNAQIDIRNEKYLMDQRLLSLAFEDDEFNITNNLLLDKIFLKRKTDPLIYFINEFTKKVSDSSEYYKVESLLEESYHARSIPGVINSIKAYYDFLFHNSELLAIFRENVPKNNTLGDLQKITLILFGQLFNESSFPRNEKGFVGIYELLYNSKLEKGELTKELIDKMIYIYDQTRGLNFACINLLQKLSIYYNFWEDHFSYDFKSNFEKTLFNYCVIKSFKIIKYPKYNILNREDTIEYFAANFTINEGITEIAHRKFLTSLLNDSSHISLKLRQCITLLEVAIEDDNNELINFFYNQYNNKTNKAIDVSVLNSLITSLSLSKGIYKLLLLPPRIFEVDIYLKSVQTGQENISINTLSSGEYQKISIISSIIYHLKNIDSVIPSEREELQGEFMRFKLPPVYNFENVNIILDEIELYFHPEFQRAFIKELLDRINSINFEKLKSINILFITHSPFILSDIPKSNILFLENGLPVFPMTENTFASNIHTLLQHGFFLNSVPIGDFAKNKINSLFKILHEGDIKDNNGNDIYEQILIVSEPFIKNQLLKLYNGLNPKSKNFELESVVKELKRELNELKKRIND